MLLPLRQHVIGNRHRNARQMLGKNRLHAALMHRRQVRVQQHHRHRAHFAFRTQPLRQSRHLRFIERVDDFPRSADALIDFIGMAALHERLRLHPLQVVMVLAVAAANERNVAEAARGDIRHAGTLALQQRVGGHRGADADGADGVNLPESLQAGHDRFNRIMRRREVLPDFQRAPGFVIGHEIGEGAANIHAKPVAILHDGTRPLSASRMAAVQAAETASARNRCVRSASHVMHHSEQ